MNRGTTSNAATMSSNSAAMLPSSQVLAEPGVGTGSCCFCWSACFIGCLQKSDSSKLQLSCCTAAFPGNFKNALLLHILSILSKKKFEKNINVHQHPHMRTIRQPCIVQPWCVPGLMAGPAFSVPTAYLVWLSGFSTQSFLF